MFILTFIQVIIRVTRVKIAQELIKALNSTETGREVIAKFQIDAKDAQVGVIGDQAHIEGGIHFGDSKK